MKKIARIERLASCTPDHGSPSESNFQEREEFDVDLLPVNKRSRDIRMSRQPTKELVDPDWPEVREKTRQAEWLGVHQPDHVDGFDVVIPRHRIGPWSPRKTLPAEHELPVAQVHRGVGIQKSGAVDWADGTGRHLEDRRKIGLGDEVDDGSRRRGSRRRVLVLRTHIQRNWSYCRAE